MFFDLSRATESDAQSCPQSRLHWARAGRSLVPATPSKGSRALMRQVRKRLPGSPAEMHSATLLRLTDFEMGAGLMALSMARVSVLLALATAQPFASIAAMERRP